MRGFNYMECNTLRRVYINQKIKRNDHISTTTIIGVQFKLEMLWALYHSLRNGIDHYTKDHIKRCCDDLLVSQMVDPVTINTIVYNVSIMESKDIKNIKESNDDFISVICNSYEIFAIEDGTEIEIKARKLSNDEAKSKFRKYIYIRLNGKCYKVRIKNYSSTSIDDLLTRLSTLIDINDNLYEEYNKGSNTNNIDKDKLHNPGLLSGDRLINKNKEDDDSKSKSPLYDAVQNNLYDIIEVLEEEGIVCHINGNTIDMNEDVDATLLISDCIAYFYKNMDVNDLDKYSVSTIVINNDIGDRQLMYFLLTDGYDSEKTYNTKDLGYKERQLLNDINLAMANFYMKKFNVSEDTVLEPLNNIPYCKLHNDEDNKIEGGIAIDDRPKDLPDSFHNSTVNNAIKEQVKELINKIFENNNALDGVQIIKGYIDNNGTPKILSNNISNIKDDEDDGTVTDLHKYISEYNSNHKDDNYHANDIKILDIIASFFDEVYKNNFRFDFIREQVPSNTLLMINALKEFISIPLKDSIISHISNNRFDINPSMGFFSIFDIKIFDEYILSFVLYYDGNDDKYKITTFYPETCSGFTIREHTLNLRNSDEVKKLDSCIIINSKFGYTILSYDPSDILYYLPKYSVNKKTIVKDNKKFGILDNIVYTLLTGYMMYMMNTLIDKKSIINNKLFNDISIDPNFNDIMNSIEYYVDNNILTKVDMIFLIISLKDCMDNKNTKKDNKVKDIFTLKGFHNKDIHDFKEFITYDSMSYNLNTVFNNKDGYEIYKKGTEYTNISTLRHPMSFYKDKKEIFNIKSSMNSIKDDETVSNLYKILKFVYMSKYGKLDY